MYQLWDWTSGLRDGGGVWYTWGIFGRMLEERQLLWLPVCFPVHQVPPKKEVYFKGGQFLPRNTFQKETKKKKKKKKNTKKKKNPKKQQKKNTQKKQQKTTTTKKKKKKKKKTILKQLLFFLKVYWSILRYTVNPRYNDNICSQICCH